MVRLGRWLEAGSWLYAAAALVLWISLRGLGDRWWPMTLLLFAPRWPYLLPLAALVPAALVVRPKALVPLLVASALLIGPVMGFHIPWRLYWSGGPSGPDRVRILTCNVHFSRLDSEALAELIASTTPDIILFQEWSTRYEELAGFLKRGWHVSTYKELYLASRYPILGVEKLDGGRMGGEGTAARYDLWTPGGLVRVFNIHPVSPRDGLERMVHDPAAGPSILRANIEERRDEAEAISWWTSQTTGPVILAGDFNLPRDSAIYRRYWSRYADAFEAAGLGFGYTWFSRWHGVRIDHILTGPGWRCHRCWVGPDVGSDHRPIIADLHRVGAM